jgi:hypothetical protein
MSVTTYPTNSLVDTKTVMALFHPAVDFKALFNELTTHGYSTDNVQIIMSKNAQNRYFHSSSSSSVNVEVNNKSADGFTSGALSGGVLGAIIGGLTLTGSLLIPGAQLLLLGPAIGSISGALAGSAAGGLLGALVGLGIPEVEAKFFNESLNQDDSVLVVVNASKDDAKEVKELLERFNSKKTTIM